MNINGRGGNKSLALTRKIERNLAGAELHVHIPGVNIWTTDYLSHQRLDPGQWFLHPEVFQDLLHKWGMPDRDLLAYKFNNKLDTFVSKCKDILLEAVDALFLISHPASPLLPLIVWFLKREATSLPFVI